MVIVQKTTAAAILMAILNKRRRNKKLQKRVWCRQWIQRRNIENTAENLLHDLKNEPTDEFRRYFRMSSEQFDILHEKVRPAIQKNNTHMRKAISTELRLAITLRYLSTGDSYRSLMLLFKVAHNTISGIVASTCKAIYSSLANDYLKVLIKRILLLFRTSP